MQRLDQLLASLGYGSRREVSEWVWDGLVSVKGIPAKDAGARVNPAEVTIEGEPLDHPGELLILLNKPAGVVCSHDEREGPSIYTLIPERWRRRNPAVTSIGRLDKETTGLLLLTDKSGLVHRLTSPKHKVPKVYRATLDKDIPEGIEKVFASGTLKLEDDDKPCAPAILTRLGPRQADVVMTEGRYHQVRRMFATQGCEVIGLDRMKFGPLELGDLALGNWIELPVNSLDNI
ncbi:MAG TPA: pseudouridine synthase [Opitutaceae bacterium]|jgi:16S rRNA pseudouridine516 synthase|nr:pseudouridine synthase [Opitutaceae bacterium]